MLNRSPFARAALAALALIAAAPAGTAMGAVPDPSVHLTTAQSGQFQEALDVLAAQGHVALIAEGAPLTSRLSADAAPDLTAGEPLSRAVSALAAAYDYDAQREDGNVFILTKRYTDPRDLPCVTLGECLQASHDLVRVLDALNPHLATSTRMDGPDGQRAAVLTFFNSLTPDQIHAVQTKTLRYADLSPGQQEPIQQLFYGWEVQQPATQVEASLSALDNARKSKLTAQDEHGLRGAFIQEADPNDPDVHDLVPLSGPAGRWGASPPMALLSPPPPGATPAVTLASVVAGLPHGDGPATVVDQPLRAKPLTVAGLNNAASDDVVHALEALYGLRIGATPARAPELEPRWTPSPTTLRELAQDVWLTLPVSYARALHLNAPPTPPKTKAGDWTAVLNQADLRRHSEALPGLIGDAAARRVLAALQPQVRLHGPDVKVAVSTLDEPARAALAVALMARTVQALQSNFSPKYNGPVAECLDDPDTMLIYTKPDQVAHVLGMTLPSIYLEEIDPVTGKNVGLGGVAFSSYP